MDPDVDAKTKTVSHRKIIRKAHKNNNLLKIKWMLKPKYKLSGRQFFTCSLPGGQLAPLSPVSYATGCDILYLHAVSCPYSTATRYELVA